VLLLLVLASASRAWTAEFHVERLTVTVMKSVFGQVKSRDILPARARIGGTILEITVDEGDQVTAGDVIASVVDPKLALRLNALDAKIKAIAAQLENARTNKGRAEDLFTKGTIAKSQLDEQRTRFDVLSSDHNALKAERSVIAQESKEGAVVAPATGRVLSIPLGPGSVVLSGETVATIAGGGYFLRLSLPERHALGFVEGDEVIVGQRGLSTDQTMLSSLKGKIVKIYPEIRDGRVLADVDVAGLGNYFVGERTLVSIPIGSRQIIAVPPDAIVTRHGLDFVTVAKGQGRIEVAVIPGETFSTPSGPQTEILTGLRVGDTVSVP